MLASLLIVFREVFEAGLIVGIVLAATVGVPHRGRFVAGGILAGALGAAILAAFAGALSNAFEGVGQEVFTASILLIAVVMLGWHNTWMASHGREMAQEMKRVGQSVSTGDKSLLALAVVVAVAVLREGAEVVLFLYGIAASTQEGPVSLFTGGLLGIVAGALVSWLLYRGLVAIPMKHFFTVTNWMLSLLAAGMAGQAAATLVSAGLVPTLGDELWDTSGILPDNSMVGHALRALIGYSDRPTGIQLLAFLVTLTVLIVLARIVGGQQRPRQSRPVPQSS